MEPQISIIVPVYNTEEYIERCIRSIMEQTYENLEILLIDDGSTDNSGKLADEYVKDDARIKVYHKKNGGLSDARNYGFSMSTAEYVCFIDSDDFISLDFYEKLYKKAIADGADIAKGNHKTYELKYR